MFLHGVETVETTTSTRTIRGVKTAVIGLVGTAPTWQLAPGDRTVNVPRVIASEADAARYFGTAVAGYTIPQALRAIFAQGKGIVVVVNTFDAAVHKTVVAPSDIILDANGVATLPHQGVTGVVVKNAAGAVTYVLDVDYTLDAVAGKVVRIPAGAIIAGATLKINYDRPNPAAVVGADIIGAVSGAGVRTGAQALLDVAPTFGFAPKVLIAPAFSTTDQVADALETLANTLRAIALVDAPAGTTLATVLAGRGNAGAINFQRSTKRVLLCYPYVKALDAAGVEQLEPLSQRLAGAIAARDIELGFWYSPSNAILAGVKGLERALTFSLSDPTSDVNQLNEAGIVTVANINGEFRTWGNRSSAYPTSSEPDVFVAVRRVADVLHESIELASLPFVDQPISAALIDVITGTVNRYMRSLIGRGALIAGSCRYDAADNADDEVAAGHLTFRLDFMPPPPAERITYRSTINIDLLSTLSAQ